MGLNKWYIGDGMPLCVDLPSKHFLKKGATYRLLGTSSSPRYLREPAGWAKSQNTRRLLLSPNSKLYEKLCNQAVPGTGPCRYEAKVVLDEVLPCYGDECEIESPRVLEVEPGLYYEYSHVRCTQQAFYSDAKTMRRKGSTYFCGDPRTETGALGCCLPGDNDAEILYEKFAGERLSYQAAEQRCIDNELELCSVPRLRCSSCDTADTKVGYWSTRSCNLKVKIGLDGNIAIVHSEAQQAFGVSVADANVREGESKTFFRVDWDGNSINDVLADYSAKCAELGCTRGSNDNLCLCPTNVLDTQAFSAAPSLEDVMNLPIGSFPPEYLDQTFLAVELGGGVRMHSADNQYSMDSIFEVVDENGVTHFRKNMRSVVSVGSNPLLPLSFRNPPHLMSISYPDLRDAHYETDAGLDHYFVSSVV